MNGCGAAREDAKAGVARVAVDVDEDVDAVFRDLCGGFVVGHAADVAPVIDARLDAGLDRIVGLDAGVIGEDLEVVAVVLFEEVDHQVADRVVAQIRADIADAQLAVHLDRRGAAVEARGAIFDRGHGAHVFVGGGELEQRIVGVGADGERMEARDQRAARDFRAFRRHRPFALRQAGGDVLFGHIAGFWREFKALRECDLGGGERLVI